MKYKCILAGIAFLLAAGFGAQAQSIHTLPQGTKLSGTVEFGRFLLALPPGDWTLVGAMRDVARMPGNAHSVPIGRAFLAQIEGGVLVALVEAVGSLDAQNVEWPFDKECGRDDLWLLEADRKLRHADQDCRYVSYYVHSWVAASGAPPSTKQALDWLRDNRVHRPPQMLHSHFRRVRFGDTLTVSYFLNPEHFGQTPSKGTTWTASDWHKTKLAANPKRRQFADAWIDWSGRMAPVFADGFRGNRTDAAPAFPFPPQSAALPPRD
ncbi:MAG: hypothetical protein HY059_21660 [Proteobacteria bacterium]|nr:hypothetical protein [Pseudomonadota bacterium]